MSENTKICPKCRTEIDKKATVCPNCKSKLWPSKLLVGLLLFVGLSVVMALLNPEGSSWEPGMVDLCVYSQMRVEEWLKAPSTAKHPVCSEDRLIRNGNEYKYTSYVDAENSFGAMIRTNYTCNINIEWKSYTISCITE